MIVANSCRYKNVVVEDIEDIREDIEDIRDSIDELCELLRRYNRLDIISMNGITNMVVSYDEVLVDKSNGVLYLVIGEDINNSKHSSRVRLYYNAIRVVREYIEDGLVEITV